MKDRLEYLAPGLALVAYHGLLWAIGVPASHASILILSVAFLVLMDRLFAAHRRTEEIASQAVESAERNLTTVRYLQKVLYAQTAAIARLQALLYRRN